MVIVLKFLFFDNFTPMMVIAFVDLNYVHGFSCLNGCEQGDIFMFRLRSLYCGGKFCSFVCFNFLLGADGCYYPTLMNLI